MKILSKHTQLSREYTNYLIRATSVTILDQCGFEARHIMCISGHTSEISIASKTSDGVKLAITSSGLSNALCDVPDLDKRPKIGLGHSSTAAREPLQDTQNSVTIHKIVAIDSTMSSGKSEFCFYNCTVHILNKYSYHHRYPIMSNVL
jgi:hypothetical protein